VVASFLLLKGDKHYFFFVFVFLLRSEARLTFPVASCVLAKAEFMNPGGSVKDRAALGILEAAEKEGKLKKGDWVVEATAGNTGIGLVHLCNQRGYKYESTSMLLIYTCDAFSNVVCGSRCYFTAPESCSQEKIDALRIRGARVEVCPAVPGDGMYLQR
jgi:cysteine synthase A